MAFPLFFRRLFEKMGAGPLLRGDIMPYGDTAQTVCQGNDARLGDARSPTAHKNTHKAGGSDALTPADIGAAGGDHQHAAGDVTSGILPVARGGTGRNDGKAAALATARTIDGVSFDGSGNRTHYATCSTAAATTEKTVPLAGFVLATGARITVRFTTTNTAATPALNVNATGAKPIRYRNAAVSPGVLAANRTYAFAYDGTAWQLEGDIVQAGAGLSVSNAGVAAVKYGTTAGTAAQGNDVRLAGGADWTASKPDILQRMGALEAGPPAHKHSAADLNAGTLPAARGGTGQTSLQATRNAMGLGNTTGPLPVANGGTGNTTGKAPTAGTADNAALWAGHALSISAAGPAGLPEGGIHLQYI